MRTLQMLKFKSFSVKAVRDMMRTTLDNLPFDVPFSATSRFPTNEMYIDLSHSVPNAYLRQLIQALDLADRQIEKDRSMPPELQRRLYSNFEDAKVSFYQALYALIDLVGPLQPYQAYILGVYTQSSFEVEHELAWK